MKKKINMSDLDKRLSALEDRISNGAGYASAAYNNAGVDFPQWPEIVKWNQAMAAPLYLTEQILKSPERSDQILEAYERVMAVTKKIKKNDNC